jgi:thioredoxin-like negative regulator of GroEL
MPPSAWSTRHAQLLSLVPELTSVVRDEADRLALDANDVNVALDLALLLVERGLDRTALSRNGSVGV